MLNNFVDALSDVIFFEYSHEPSGISVDVSANTLVQSAETLAESYAEAFFSNSGLSEIFSESSGIGTEGAFQGSAASEAQIVAGFSVEAEETFRFNFFEDLLVEAKEIENPDAEYNQAELNIGFLLLDTSDATQIRLIDYVTFEADLISSEQIGGLEIVYSDHFTVDENVSTLDIDGDNEVDFISSTTLGNYERTFDSDTDLTLVKVSQNAVQWIGDSFIGNLGPNFTYGTIWDDRWFGTDQDDKYYASLGDDRLFAKNGNDKVLAGPGDDVVYGGNGNDTIRGGGDDDRLYGGNGDDRLRGDDGDDLLNASNGDDRLWGGRGDDILNASNGDDRLWGGQGNDILNGSNGDDRLKGGQGDDILTGGFGSDRFIYKTAQAFNSIQVGVDLITDFRVTRFNRDKIVLSEGTFTSLSSTIDGLIDPNEFEVVANDALADISEAFITYSSSTGNLFYNQNGSEGGFGQGDLFVTLQDIPTLSAADIMLIP